MMDRQVPRSFNPKLARDFTIALCHYFLWFADHPIPVDVDEQWYRKMLKTAPVDLMREYIAQETTMYMRPKEPKNSMIDLFVIMVSDRIG